MILHNKNQLVNNIKNQNTKLLFSIILKDTKTTNSKTIFICIDLTTNKIISTQLILGVNYNKIFKLFVTRTFNSIRNDNNISKIFLPNVANSKQLNDFLSVTSKDTKIEYYTINSLIRYKNIFKNIRKVVINTSINNIEDLTKFKNSYNNKDVHKINNSILPKVAKRNYSTTTKTINEENKSVDEKLKYG